MICYALLLLRIVPVFPNVLSGIISNRVLFGFAAVCFASMIWSRAPGTSMAFSVQYLITLLFGLWLGLRFHLRQIVLLLFWSSFALVVLSGFHYLTGVFPIAQFDSDGRVIGVFVHKSYLARQALICTLSAIALLLPSEKPIGRLTLICAVLAPLLSTLLIVLSKSMTNILILPLAVGFLVILCRQKMPRQFMLWSLAICVLVVALVPVVLAALGIDPINAIFDATGKDRTLTGRTVIWDIAFAQVSNHPFFGVGFGAFWEAPEYAAQRFQILIAGATSPSLHNFVLEILVATGLVGLCAALVFIFSVVTRCYRLWWVSRTADSAFALALSALLVVLSLNTPGLSGQHEIQFVLLMAFAVSARRGLHAYRQRRNRFGTKVRPALSAQANAGI